MNAILFDLGKVLLDWNPRYFYSRFFDGNDAALERFLAEAVPGDWVLEMDAGKPSAVAIAERQRRLPRHAELIGRWSEGWPQMLRGAIHGSVAILAELRRRGLSLYALTNFSTETFPIARERCEFLGWFEDIVVSGEHGLVKPDPLIYELAIRRCRLEPARTVFIDDTVQNLAPARELGMRALHFTGPARLRENLEELGLLG